MESNQFMLGYVSICPETTYQKLESQRVHLTLKTMDLLSLHNYSDIHVDVFVYSRTRWPVLFSPSKTHNTKASSWNYM